jgi:hypothetical protein
MQYFKPERADQFVGDAMPFWSNGRYHLYYLVDENHHHGLGGMGGHQWAHASTTDLVHWERHPMALSLGEAGSYDDGSICTGSLFEHEGTYYAFYAGRSRDSAGNKIETVCLATSPDAIHFTKHPGNPIIVPGPMYQPADFRDPNVFLADDGLFHMLVTTRLSDEPVAGRGGCLAHLTSCNLVAWEYAEAFLTPGMCPYPECADYFQWNDWYYVIYLGPWGRNHYRMSRNPFGPWLRPAVDTLDGRWLAAMKTAAFGPAGERRIGVGFLPCREGGRDDGGGQYAGNAVFREIVQNPDGALSSKFPAEMAPATGEFITARVTALSGDVAGDAASTLTLADPEGLSMAAFEGIPADARIRMRVTPSASAREFGLVVRGAGRCETGYEVRFIPAEKRVRVKPVAKGEDITHSLQGVEGLDRPFSIELVMTGDILDLCIDERMCFVNRYGEARGDRLFLFCENGEVTFEGLQIMY